MNYDEKYNQLATFQVTTAHLVAAAELAAWDQRVFIPSRGHAHRAETMAALAGVIHERATSPLIGEALNDLESCTPSASADHVRTVNVQRWRRAYDRAVRIPSSLAVALARAASRGESEWEAARPKNDWATFAPHLEELLRLSAEKAHALGFAEEPWDALIDEYEPGETARSVEALFLQLKAPLRNLLDRIARSKVTADDGVVRRSFPVAEQKKFCRFLAGAIGYDLEAGRIDETAHPFAVGIGPSDVRITTRYFENQLNSSVFGVLHEAGHALYEQGLPAIHFGTPAGQTASLGVHESQSRLWENIVGRSEGFWRFAFPKAQQVFSALADVSLDQFLRAINCVRPGVIRVEADEVSYNLHVLVRFELELALFRDQLAVADLPAAWNEKMRELLGVVSPELKDGVLQDVHWSGGMFGYFPTYTMGNLYAAQLFESAGRDIGVDLNERFASGDFAPLLHWLRENIHERGHCFDPRDLIARATSAPPASTAFLNYLENRFSRIYQL